MSKRMRGNLMLIMAAFIWGTSFVAQKSGLDSLGPLAFNGIRTLIGGLALIPVIRFLDIARARKTATFREEQSGEQAPRGTSASETHLQNAADESSENNRAERRTLLTGGLACGIVLMLASNLQQIGISYTTAGKAGFITALYVVLVPVFRLFLGKKARPVIWLCVAAAAIGLYLLCIPADDSLGHINKGDLLVSVCAVVLTVHILIIDHFSPKVDGVRLSCMQFLVAGTLSLAFIWLDPLLGFALPTIKSICAAAIPLLYAGLLSCGVAYTFQVIAQADTDPTIASMILCLESVFAVLAGTVVLGESMTVRETFGCVIMFAAIIVSQLPKNEKERIGVS